MFLLIQIGQSLMDSGRSMLSVSNDNVAPFPESAVDIPLPDDIRNVASPSNGDSDGAMLHPRVVSFKKNRSVCSVLDAWTEYRYGLPNSDGNLTPAISFLDASSGGKWQGAKSSCEGKFYARRSSLWTTITMVLEQNPLRSEQEILRALQDHLDSEKISLRKLCDRLAALLKNHYAFPEMPLLEFCRRQPAPNVFNSLFL